MPVKTMFKALFKAIGMIRVSTDMQAKTNDSFDGQKRDILKWAKENGFEIEKFYYEPGNSAYRGKRPILDLILHEINEGIVSPNAVIVFSYSRFTRNASITGGFKKSLQNKDIPILSVTEPMPEDEDTAFISQTVIDMVNEIQSRMNSKVVQNRLNDTANKGYFTGGTVPYGYSSVPITIPNTSIEKKVLARNTEESVVVKEIFDLAETGVNGKPLGVENTARYLNNKGISYRGKEWNKNKISDILKNTLYYGKRVWGTKRITRAKENPPIIINIPPIISEEQFLSVRKGASERLPFSKDKVAINKFSKGIRSKTLLTGILQCQYCGANLRVSYSNKKLANGDVNKHTYYGCPNHAKKKCVCPYFIKEEIDKVIIDSILLNILNKKVIVEIIGEIKDKISEVTKHDAANLLKLNKKQSSLKLKINKLYDMVAEEILELDETLKGNLNNNKTALQNVNYSIDEIKSRSKLPLRKFGNAQITCFINAIIKVFVRSNEENSKQILLKVIDKILVGKDKIEVIGARFKLAEFVSKTKMGTSNEVPTFVSMWR
jgi:site-specific DNA recombinase